MKIKIALVAIIFLGLPAFIANAQQRSDAIQIIRSADGKARLVGSDGENLGVVSSNRYLANSICNPTGLNGSRFATRSIWNRSSEYGDGNSDKSAYNPRAEKPPILLLSGGASMYVTKNPRIPGIDPDDIYQAICK
jgi:hypothetical protein